MEEMNPSTTVKAQLHVKNHNKKRRSKWDFSVIYLGVKNQITIVK